MTQEERELIDYLAAGMVPGLGPGAAAVTPEDALRARLRAWLEDPGASGSSMPGHGASLPFHDPLVVEARAEQVRRWAAETARALGLDAATYRAHVDVIMATRKGPPP